MLLNVDMGDDPMLETHVAIARAQHLGKSRDFSYVAHPNNDFLAVGREMKPNWEDDDALSLPLFARLVQELRSLRRGGEIEEAEFRAHLNEALLSFQADLEQQGEVPSLILTVAYVSTHTVHVGHVGDSRCYLVRGRTATRLTHDQLVHPQPSDRPDVSDPLLSMKLSNEIGGPSRELDVGVCSLELGAGDMLVLCTSGVTHLISDDELASLLTDRSREDEGLDKTAARVLKRVADGAAGRDRTIVIARRDPHTNVGDVQ